MVVYKSIKPSDLPRILREACETTAVIMFLIAASAVMSFVLSFTGLPDAIGNALLSVSDNKYVILLLINLLLLFVGCFMDTTPAMMVLSPILLPVALEMGLSAVHFGIIMVVNLAIGFITPPLGINLFVAARVGNTSLEVVCKGIVRFILVMIVCLLLITYIPAISEVLPRMTGMLK